MGRPYKNELCSLSDTYQWVISQDRNRLQQLVHDQRGKTLIAIGSGGSYSMAVAAVALHRHFQHSPAYSKTPLELEVAPLYGHNLSVWLFSGSGRNIDIRRALKTLAPNEGNQLTIFCGKIASPLESDARKTFVDRIFSFDSGLGKDGYLATNSLFASLLLMVSAFRSLPCSLSDLLESATDNEFDDELFQEQILKAAKGKSNVIILHGPCGKAGALDLESKCTEGAIIASSATDYRNFAHGRHNWINRFGEDSFIIAFVGSEERPLAQKTLALVPTNVPRIIVPLGNDFALAQALAIYYSINIAGWLGELHGLDVGRPKIPEFGRKLYHLRVRLSSVEKYRSNLDSIIDRKTAALGIKNVETSYLEGWRTHYKSFREHLIRNDIGAIIFDYDGTLVRNDARSEPLSNAVIKCLVRILEAGLPVGIATGRGDSVRTMLECILPIDLCDRVLIGYVNASKISPLDRACIVDGDIENQALAQFCARFRHNSMLGSAVKIRTYPQQVTIRPNQERAMQIESLWAEIYTIIASSGENDLRALVSGHSVDVIPRGVSKQNLVAAVADVFSIDKTSILRIGDQGRWPGNDFELLRSPMGLSVGDVSADTGGCWNLLPARCSGVDGTLYYLNQLKFGCGVARIRL